MTHVLTLFSMGLFGAAHGMMEDEGGQEDSLIPQICHTYSTMMKLGTVIPFLKKFQNYMNHVTHLVSSANITIFHWKSANFVISRNVNIDSILVHNF